MREPLFAIASTQQGVVTRSQLLEHGNSPAIRRRFDAGWLVPLYPGVYCVASTPIGLMQRIIATGLMHPFALVDAHCALLLYGVLAAVQPRSGVLHPEFVVPANRQIRLPEVRVRRQRHRENLDRSWRHGVPVLSPARLIVDMASFWSMGAVARTLDALLRERLVTIAQVQRTHTMLNRRGRKGVRVLDALLNERLAEGARPSNVSERRVRMLLVRSGFPDPVAQFEVVLASGRRFIDLAYPQWKIAIEFDGFTYHSVRVDWAADQVRNNELVAAGWRILRVTDETLSDPAAFLTQLRLLMH